MQLTKFLIVPIAVIAVATGCNSTKPSSSTSSQYADPNAPMSSPDFPVTQDADGVYHGPSDSVSTSPDWEQQHTVIYYPKSRAYYYPDDKMYYWVNGDTWNHSKHLPWSRRHRANDGVTVMLNDKTPYRYDAEHFDSNGAPKQLRQLNASPSNSNDRLPIEDDGKGMMRRY